MLVSSATLDMATTTAFMLLALSLIMASLLAIDDVLADSVCIVLSTDESWARPSSAASEPFEAPSYRVSTVLASSALVEVICFTAADISPVEEQKFCTLSSYSAEALSTPDEYSDSLRTERETPETSERRLDTMWDMEVMSLRVSSEEFSDAGISMSSLPAAISSATSPALQTLESVLPESARAAIIASVKTPRPAASPATAEYAGAMSSERGAICTITQLPGRMTAWATQ